MSGYVYIMASKRNVTIYTGVTSDLQERARQHRESLVPGFAKRYGCKLLVWFEQHPNIVLAIKREKSIKEYRRQWKLNLIKQLNPVWEDLFDKVYEVKNPYRPHPNHPNFKSYPSPSSSRASCPGSKPTNLVANL